MQHPKSAAVVVVMALSTVACDGGPPPDDPYVLAASALCDASAGAARGELDLARQAFYDTAHRPLHDLAAEVAVGDRVLAARLLEAKESVEFGLDNEEPAIAESFRTLVGAADDALRATGHGPVPCSTDGP